MTTKNFSNSLKWTSVKHLTSMNSLAMKHQSSRVQLLRLLKLRMISTIQLTLVSLNLWTLLTHTFQHQKESQISHSLCQLKTYSQSQVVVQLLLVELKEVSSRLLTKLKSLVLRMKAPRQLLQVSKCSERFLTTLRQAITSVLFSVVFRDQISKEDRFFVSQAQSSHTQSSTVRYTFLRRKKAVVILHSLTTTDHSSISEQQTLLA